MKDRMSEIDRAIEKLREDSDLLKIELDHLKAMAPVERLAVELHELLCHANHADGCGWHYEINKGIHDWARGDHARWRSRALSTLNGLATRTSIDSEEELISLVLTVVRAIKR